jgi:hypothetical protein
MLRNSPKIRVETDIFEGETIRFCIWAKTDDMDSMEPRFEMKFDHISEFVSRDIEGSDVLQALKVLLKSGTTKQPRKSKEEKTLEDFQAEALKKAEYQKNLRAKQSDEKKEAEKLKRKERDAKRKAEEKKRKAENIAKAAAEAEAVDNSNININEEMSELSAELSAELSVTTDGTDQKTDKKKRKNAKKERVDEYGHDLPEFDISWGKKSKEPVDANKVLLRPIEIGDNDGEKTKYYIDPKTNRVYSNDRNKFLVGRYVVSDDGGYSEILKFEIVEETPYLRNGMDEAFIVAQDNSLTKVGDWNNENELELDEKPEEKFWPAPSGL